MANRLISLICIVFVLGIAGSASAAYISATNITASASSTWWTVGIDVVFNEVGLDTATLLHARVGTNPYNSWINSGVSDGTSYAAGTVTGYCWVAAEFDQAYSLGEMWVWNWNQDITKDRCFKDVTVQYSTDGTNWMTLAGATRCNQTPGTGPATYDTSFNFGDAAAAVCSDDRSLELG